MSEPIRHHHLPVFYLSRWTGEDGRLCQYSRPHKEIVPNRRYPSQTGFQERLYEIKNEPGGRPQRVETDFMQPLDTKAADALAMLENNDPRINRDAKARSAWSRFILSLLLRAPEAIGALKRGVRHQWSQSMPELEARYAVVKRPGDPETFADYLEQRGENDTDDWAMSLAPQLIDHRKIGDMLNNMRWLVQRITSSTAEFLTSDRPVVMSWTLTEPNAYLFLPIGPKTLFVAVNDVETQRVVQDRDPLEQVEAVNRYVAGRGVNFVYGRDDSHLAFVRQHMGKHRRLTLFEQLAERYRPRAGA